MLGVSCIGLVEKVELRGRALGQRIFLPGSFRLGSPFCFPAHLPVFPGPGGVVLKVLQDVLGAGNDAVRQAGKPGHLDAIAAIRTALDNFPQENDFIIAFTNRDIGVADTLAVFRQCGKLMVMGGEEGAALNRVMQVFSDRPGNA